MKEPILEMRGITKTFGSAYTVVSGTNKFLRRKRKQRYMKLLS